MCICFYKHQYGIVIIPWKYKCFTCNHFVFTYLVACSRIKMLNTYILCQELGLQVELGGKEIDKTSKHCFPFCNEVCVFFPSSFIFCLNCNFEAHFFGLKKTHTKQERRNVHLPKLRNLSQNPTQIYGDIFRNLGLRLGAHNLWIQNDFFYVNENVHFKN